MKDTLKIFIGNVDERTSEEELSALFEQYGPVASCAVMKQYAFVHMRGADRAQRAIDELNGRELHGKKMVVELSKPRPQNTWKIFIGNVSAACDATELRAMFEVYGSVVECDVVKDYAFVHMEKESDAKNAIENLNGKEVKGKRINVEMSNKASKAGGANGARGRRPQDVTQNRADLFTRRATEAAYASFGLKSPYDRYMGESTAYDAFENRVRPPSPSYYQRDRSPLRRSPTRSPYGLAQSANAFASKYRSATSGYGSLPSAYGDQATSASALAAGFGSQASAYGSRAGAGAYGSAYGAQGGYESQASGYGADAQAAYGAQSSAYGLQGSSLASTYGSQLSSMAAYSSQTSSNPYAAHTGSNPYAASSAMASAYRQQQASAYDTSQMSGLGMQSAYSSLGTAMDSQMYERARLSPPMGSATDGFKGRLDTDRRYTDIADYRRLTQESQDPFRRSPPRSQMDYRRPAETNSDYYSEYMRAAQMSGYQRRL